MVTYIRSDLDFILDQIKIAEAHAAGQSLFGGPNPLIPANNISWGLRTVDGTYNNLIPGRTTWGSADQPFPTLIDPDYRPTDETFDPDGDGPAPAMGAPNYNPTPNQPGAVVVDSAPRTISNLIVDMSPNNPAAVEKALDLAGIEGQAKLDAINAIATAVEAYSTTGDLVALQTAVTGQGLEMAGVSLVMPNVSPDEGLSAPFNSWFTLFGQFFDHGLDLVAKGQSGTVFVPLQPDDPLWSDEPGAPNFMVLTRATVDEQGQTTNITTPFVDQNQTYTSHPSHQVFLREYVMTDGGPVATGKALDGPPPAGGLPTWGQIKAQAAEMLGITLEDVHVGNLPLLATDPYGNFIPDPDSGFPQVVMYNDPNNPGAGTHLESGTPGAPLNLANTLPDGPDQDTAPDFQHLAVRTGHAFLDDIAHTAVPAGLEDGDTEIGLDNGDGSQTDANYDNELLDAHFITGDGRGNENIGLTAVHTVFHAEHNRLVEHTKTVVLAENDLEFLNEWLRVDIGALPANQAEIDALQWDGERLFQAAKFGTEMQYQHLVFEEFARKIQPNIDVFLVPQGYDTTIDPAIVSEFANVVYRFGHSMLTESIDRFDADFNPDDIGLIEGFLNPTAFLNGGTAAEATGSIIRGMTRQVGNEIDEFVTGALRNNLLGLPLDLATINLARGRDTGVPSLNAARREFYEVTNNNSELRPYESWIDFADGIKNPASIVNFIAAYGTHALITGATTLETKRDAALAIITGQQVGDALPPADAEDFLNGIGAYAGDLGGLENVDLWIGGLAEKNMPFGGMLGSTFNFVFEVQMEKLQNSDRFYYLQRLDGLHLFGEMEANSFASIIMRNTDAIHLPSDVFSTPGLILEVNQARQRNDIDGDGDLESDDPVGGTILNPLVDRTNNATPGPDTNYLRYTGGDHIVLGGTDPGDSFNPSGNDILIAGIGDDTIHGDGGNDHIEGGAGNDIINAGSGDDIVTDLGGDDNIKGGDGNDAVNAGQGLNLVLGGAGKDFIMAGSDGGSEVFGGTGDDFILGTRTTERILGNEGSDWIEEGTFDGAPGDNFDEIFANDQVLGHDVFLGDGSTDEFIGEGGDDIMVGSAGINKLEGMSGFDWATYKDNPQGQDNGDGLTGVWADLTLNAFDEFPLPPPLAALDQYGNVEGLSGSAFNDRLDGSESVAADIASNKAGGSGGNHLDGSKLVAERISLVNGLSDLLGNGVLNGDGDFDGGDIILGGAGNDLITGRGGDDIIDGDRWLNVRISVRANADGTGEEIGSHTTMKTLVAQVFSGAINPGQLQIVREIVDNDEASGNLDIAVYRGTIDEYDIERNLPGGGVRIIHARGTQQDGTDTLYNTEKARFAGGVEVFLNDQDPTGELVISDTTPTQGFPLTATHDIDDPNGTTNAVFSYQWQSRANDLAPWVAIAGATLATFTPPNNSEALVGQQLRVVVSFTDDQGSPESVASAATAVLGDNYVGTGANNIRVGNEGSDLLLGMGGADTLTGNGGDDTLDGGLGGDILDGGEGNDTLIGGANGGADTLRGDAGNDNLDGGGGSDVLDGGTGADTMAGGAGNDNYTVDDIGDVVIEAAAGGTADVVNTSLNEYSLGANVERLFFTGAGSFTGTGNALTNQIGGGDQADILDGGAGNDQMTGLGGDDTYYFDSASDTAVEAVDGGIDTVYASVTDTMNANIENLILVGVGNIGGTGNAGDNNMTGNSGINSLNGGGGNDTIDGGAGNDSLNGAAGNDTLDGGEGNDTLSGGANNDRMTGGAGDDSLVATGTGFDTLVFAPGFGNDTVTGFDANATGGQDLLDFTAYNGLATIEIDDVGANTLITIGSDTITLLGVNGVGANVITNQDFILV